MSSQTTTHAAKAPAKGAAKASSGTYISLMALVMMNVTIIGSVANDVQQAYYGLSSVTLFIIGALVFFLPTGLVAAELASGWGQRGGIFRWVGEAMGPGLAFTCLLILWFQTSINFGMGVASASATIGFYTPDWDWAVQFMNHPENQFFIILAWLAYYWGLTFLSTKGVKAFARLTKYGVIIGTFIPLAFIVIFTVIFRKFSRRAYRKVKDATTDINTYLSENLSGIKVTQIFGREDEKMTEFRQKSQTLARANQEQIFVFGVFRPLVYMLYISSILCLFYLGGMGHLTGATFLGQSISSGTIVTFYMYISKFFTPIQNLAEQFNWLQSAFASSEKVFSIMDIEPKMQDAPDAIELEDIKGEIEFKDVWFSYIPGEWVLQGVSFHVNPRQTVAFVGSTGSGKSTILSLICRNYEFQRGEILIDGIDIRKIKISCLRKHFGQMLQDVFLFSGTIRSNIVLREENIPDEEIMEVCRYVNADHFINKLDHGLDEEVRERGNNFSAGQRQLLSFARTILHKPSVMILDEATANIDTETELLIQDSLEKMRSVGTMLIVAHRLSTIQHADNIIVLSHGKILEQGTHQQLLARHGRYYQLYTLQYHKEQLNLQ